MFNTTIFHVSIPSYFSILLTVLLYSLNTAAQTPAFPGAEGFGTDTPGGRGGKVLIVTNLNDSGEGSFRAAITTEGPRIIVFKTGGIINLEKPIVIKHPYVTIAGQTAPGDGICLRGNGIRIHTHDVVMRFIRVRPGEIDFGPENNWGSLDAVSIGSNKTDSVYNVVIDHCSLSWGIDENIGIWGNAHDITVQYCIISEALQISKHPKGAHSKGMLIGNKATNVSVHHNIFAHNHERNPLVNGESLVDIRNNVIYNSGRTAAKVLNFENKTKHQKVNFVGNYMIAGQNTINDWELAVLSKNKKGIKIFIENNLGPNISDYTQDNWQVVKDDETEDVVSRNIQSDSPISAPKVETYDPLQAYNIVLSESGAILPRRDPVDRKVVADIKNQKGEIIHHRVGIFEWPPLDEGISFLDSDEDGMPDHWEDEFNLNANKYKDHKGDPDNDGYTNIEEYINRTSPRSSLNDRKEPNKALSQTFSRLNLQLVQNFPNPFDDSTNVIFEIPEPAYSSLVLMNTEGKVLNKIVKGFLYDGKYKIAVNGMGLKPGIYYLVLTSNKSIKRIKIIKSGR